MVGYNVFAYCNNNPISYCDPMGTCPHDGELYTSGKYAGLPKFNPACQLCKAHGTYELNGDVFYAFSEWTSPVDHADYHNEAAAAAFGYMRDGGTRTHKGVDFYPSDSSIYHSGSDGTPKSVYAMYSGTVIAISGNYYAGTGAVYVQQDDGYTVIYGEIDPTNVTCAYYFPERLK